MAKAKKHYLEKKIEGVDQKYSKILGQYSELKNIYRGKDKEGKRNKKLHKLKDRYGAAEAYLQGLDKQNLAPEQRKYLGELARTFVEYDLKLDKKRKSSEYIKSLREKRINHLGRTLESMTLDETPAQAPSTAYKTLDNYVQQPKITTPAVQQPKIVVSPAFQASQARIPSPGLTTRMYNTTKGLATKVYSSTKDFTKKYWKYGATFVAGAAIGSLLTYYCMTKPVTKPVPQPIKQEQIIKKQEPKTPIIKKQEPKSPIIKKQTPPVIKKEEQKPVIKEEQKPAAPKVEQIILSEKDWTKNIKKGEIDLSKYDVFFSGMWHDPGAIVLYEKGNDKIRFDMAMSGQLMWEDVETKKELEDLVGMMEKNNMFGSGRIALRAEYIKNKYGETVGIIFTDAINRTIIKQKDGKVMVYSINHQAFNGGGGADGSSTGSNGGGGIGGGGPM